MVSRKLPFSSHLPVRHSPVHPIIPLPYKSEEFELLHMKKYDIVTALDLCVDFLIDLGNTDPQFGQKEKLVDNYSLELGGSSAIFASQAAKLGLKTAGIGKVGDDFFGNFILEQLKTTGIICEHVTKDQHLKTGIGVGLCKKDDRAILTYLGSIDAVDIADYKDSIIENTRHIHVGSYYLMKTIQPHYKNILKKAKNAGATISLDSNWDPDEQWESGIQEIMPYIDIFLPNENEALAISQTNNLDEALERLSGIVPMVVVKKGKYGATALYKGEMYATQALNIEVKDTVGAGDSFDAGFMYGFLSGFDTQTCLKIGNICGSLSTTKAGGIAGQPNIKTMNQHLLSRLDSS